MPKKFKPQVVTASDLIEGDVIYLRNDFTWSRAHEEAALAHTKEEADVLLARAQQDLLTIVGPYLAEAEIGPNGKPAPAHFREEFRTRGPSNYFHGKQEEAGNVSVL